MATRGYLKTMDFKQAELATTSVRAGAEVSPTECPPGNSTAVMAAPADTRPVSAATVRGVTNAPSPRAAPAAKGAPMAPWFTSEETILLRGLASGATSKEMAAQMRLPRESLYRLIGDLRRKTGASSDAALAVWVLRNMGSGAGERRGDSR